MRKEGPSAAPGWGHGEEAELIESQRLVVATEKELVLVPAICP